MDLAAHLRGEGRVDESLALHPAPTLEAGRDHERAEVSPAAGRAGVSGVEVALVDDLDVGRIEALPERRLDALAAIGGGGHGVRS